MSNLAAVFTPRTQEELDDLRLFWCPWCERLVPWIFGAADDTPALCDDCAVFIQDLWKQ